MPNPDSEETDNKFSLEELLSLKQQERPDDAYWERFERELRAKPWQKMVSQPSWFRRVWLRLQDTVHPAIPVASTAALALVSYYGITLAPTTAEIGPAPAPTLVAETTPPAPIISEAPAAQSEHSMADADPHFVVGTFSATASSDPAFTTVASTHYMPTSQRDGVHFAYNTIDSAAHATLAMATRPTRTLY